MKALYNPKTGMVCSWSELKAGMGHLQEVDVDGPECINQLLKPSMARSLPAEEAEAGFPVAGDDEKAYSPPPVKKASKKKVSKKKVAKKKTAVKAHSAEADTSGDDGDFGVDNL